MSSGKTRVGKKGGRFRGSPSKKGDTGRAQALKEKSSGIVRSSQSPPVTHEAVRALVSKLTGADNKAADYVRVTTDAKGDVKMSVQRPLAGDREMAKTLFGMRPIRTVLIYAPAANSSSANTAQGAADSIDPTQASEWSSFAALFDEARVDRVTSRVGVSWGSAGPLASTSAAWAVAWDPASSALLSSVAGVINHTRHAGPIFIAGGMGSAGTVSSSSSSASEGQSCVATTRHGLVELDSGRLMRGAIPLNSSGTLTPAPIQGDWFPCASTTAVVGYVKYYIEAGGGGVTTIQRSFHYLTVEFRMRA